MIDTTPGRPYFPGSPVTVGNGDRAWFFEDAAPTGRFGQQRETAMKVRNSLKTAKTRHKDCKVVRRRGRVFVINKRNPRFKARQG